jgi:hypothetical protein
MYKGYRIEAHPYQLADSGEWTINTHILIQRGSEITERPFYAGNKFQTEAEAAAHCIDFGRQIIDGKVPGCIVTDM